MTTFGTYAVAVAASLLDVSTGAVLLSVPPPLVTTRPADTLADGGGFRQVRAMGQPRSRVATIRLPEAHGADFALVRDAFLACKGPAGLLEWRHPDDDPADPPTLWRFTDTTTLAAARRSLPAAAVDFTLEEYPTYA